MGLVDRQIVAALDRLHCEGGFGHEPCVWGYEGWRDVYFCQHAELKGAVVIGQIRDLLTDEGGELPSNSIK